MWNLECEVNGYNLSRDTSTVQNFSADYYIWGKDAETGA